MLRTVSVACRVLTVVLRECLIMMWELELNAGDVIVSSMKFIHSDPSTTLLFVENK